MKKTIVLIMVCLCSLTGLASNNGFLRWEGSWNVATNWSLGAVPDDGGTYGNPVVINSSRTCTIQSGTDASVTRVYIGADAPGTLIVKGSLSYVWSTGLQLGIWNSGTGTLKILGGTVGSESSRLPIGVGSADNDHGTLQVGDGTAGGIGYFSNVNVNSDTNGISRVDLQSGELDATTVRLGDTQGTADSVTMSVGGTATLDANVVLVGVKDNVTSAELTVNGSEAVFDIANYVTLAKYSRLNFIFDDRGISTVNADKFWYDWNAEVNITGTTNVVSGTYELVVGATGGSMNANMITFNVDTNSFAAGTTLTLIHEIDSGRDAVLLEVDSPVSPVAPEIGDIALSVSGSNAVVSFNGASGFSYALQKKTDSTSDNWSNIVSGIAGAGGMQNVSNGVSDAAAFYRVVSE